MIKCNLNHYPSIVVNEILEATKDDYQIRYTNGEYSREIGYRYNESLLVYKCGIFTVWKRGILFVIDKCDKPIDWFATEDEAMDRLTELNNNLEVYNLEVEKYNDYIASRFVVHNCNLKPPKGIEGYSVTENRPVLTLTVEDVSSKEFAGLVFKDDRIPGGGVGTWLS